MVELLQEIISILYGGISGVATGIGSGLNDLVQGIFLSAEGGLSTFGGLSIVFGGIALAVGLSKFVVNWLTSFGK